MISKKQKQYEVFNMLVNYGLLNKVYSSSFNENKEVIKQRLDKELLEIKKIIYSF